MLRTILHAVVIAGALAFAGCTAKEVADVGDSPREQITHAATLTYPGNARQDDRVQAVAIDVHGRNTLEIQNPSDTQIPASTLWVNGAFVRKIGPIPPGESVTVKHSNLIQAGRGTNDLLSLDQPIERVELQTPEGLFTVRGPVTK